MTIEHVTNHPDLEYYLISYDKDGVERRDDQDAVGHGGLLSEKVRQVLRDEPITDVFFVSHGWKGDVPAAIRQYDDWIGAMAECTQDRLRVRELDPGFRPLIVGLHWPSLPWGEESQDTDEPVSFDVDTDGPGGDPIERQVEEAARTTADSDRAKEALRTIFRAADDDIEPDHLPQAVVDAYNVLAEEMGLEAEGPAAAPGDEAETLTPEERYQLAMEDEDPLSFGLFGGIKKGLLSVLGQFSFWKMKQRARTFGESGAATLLRNLQNDTADRGVRFHLMGHSFGCIVMSATIAGEGGVEPLPRPVDTAYLVQGALSYWAYCSDIPVATGKQGYFHGIPRDAKVAGPLLTTQSEHDSAVGKLYPMAAGLKRQVSFAPNDPPKYGALGTFGVRGPGVTVENIEMLPVDGAYDFAPGTVYNIESSGVINEGEGASGAHNDIGKPEVGHALWAAVMTRVGS